MKNILLSILLVAFIVPVMGQQIKSKQTKAQLASSYYRKKQYEKAAKLYDELYKESKMAHYFDYYINSLVGMKEYDEAEKAIKKQLRRTKNNNLEITLGHVYKEMGDLEKSKQTYDNVLKHLTKSKSVVISVGNAFYSKREFEYSVKTYLRGRELLEGEMFHSNLANIYYYLRDYENMMTEYMALLKEEEKRISSVQSRLNSAMRYDFDNSLLKIAKKQIIKGIQNNPEVTVYNRLLIWVFVVEKDYSQALRNSIALDKRTKTEDENILKFARSCSVIEEFDIALEGLSYLISRLTPATNLEAVVQEKANVEYLRYINTPPAERIAAEQLVEVFETTLEQLGYSSATSKLAQTYAHFLAFYQEKPDKAKQILDKALAVRALNNLQRSSLKTEQANINVYNNKLWEASFQYSQIVEGNKENTLGDEVKFLKAKVAFYLGDVIWARGLFDNLKASTSKLIANDAMEMSLLISANYDLDSIEEPIQLFAQGDLLLYQHKEDEALVMFDSIMAKYPGHSLSDKVLMRKAKIYLQRFNYAETANIYEKILSEYSYSTSADDAIYKLALLNEIKLNDKEKAQELYKRILTEYPGSIFVVDARNRYRYLRGDFFGEQEKPLYDDEDFIEP